ncbi:DUF5305 family protein [Sporosarcina sp. SAFN-015]|uniref:DUF5305 family protein n=1 Tax=Sporosarcina sp. SAFN-015 TaxID=3387274 RepID=UPI003F821D6D
MLNRILATVLKKNNKKLFVSLLSLLLIVGIVTIYTWIIPNANTAQSEDGIPEMVTAFDYKAMVTPNVLHPNGGTVEAGETLYKNITTAIPIDLKSIISADEEVLAKGSYEVQLLIKAGGNWERAFSLQDKQSFEGKGTDISVISSSYQIDLGQVNAFILQVENETGVRHPKYELEVVPTIQGELQYSDKVKELDIQDKLIFDYLPEEIKLASEKAYSTAIEPNENQTLTKSFSILGLSIPLLLVRIISISLFLLLILSILFSLVYLDEGPVNDDTSEAERLSKKYGRRVIPISEQIDFTGKTIVHFATFTSMLKIADEIEQPIFFYENGNDDSQMYLIVDLFCVYMYAPNTDIPPARPAKNLANRKDYVIG